MEFACSVCDYRSKNKDNVLRHFDRKRSCGPGTKRIIEVPIRIICNLCDKDFACERSLRHHKKNSCKYKDDFLREEVERLTKEVKKLTTENNKLKKELDKLYEELYSEDEDEDPSDYKTESSESSESTDSTSSAEADKYNLILKGLEMIMNHQSKAQPNPFESPSPPQKILIQPELALTPEPEPTTPDEGENKYIYLIQIYPYSDQIFKIGRTGDLPKRLTHYKRYKVVYATSCKDDAKCERDLVKILKAKTIHCKELGNEYFKGSYAQMKKIVKDYFTDVEV